MKSDISTHEARLEAAFRGEAIYGNDFSKTEIYQWFQDERHGYSSLDHEDAKTQFYAYRALDSYYSWRYLPDRMDQALGLGSAYGLEFADLAGKIKALSIVEPEQSYWSDNIGGIPTRYYMPRPDGCLPFGDRTFDLITAFGVLHHIPNVSEVMAELSRVLRPGGRLLVREPIVSMGDWRKARPGLTARERGLPPKCMQRVVDECGLKTVAHHQLGFGPLLKLANRMGGFDTWNSPAFTRLDQAASTAFRWNYKYHRTTIWQRFAPTVGFWALTKMT